MNTITISSSEHFDIYIEEHERYELVKKEVLGSWRHGYEGIMIFKDTKTDKFYQTPFRDSSNDMNSWEDMNYGDQKCHEVEPVEETITVYKKVEESQ